MSSRSNSSNQSKVTHLPLQKRVFNAPLAAVIAMGCVTGIAGGIAATSAHPMQAAYAASSTTQGVFTLDRAAEGMDRSAEAEVPSNTAPGFLFSDVDFKDNNMSFTWRSFTDDSFIGDIIKPALKLYYGSACTIQTPDYEKGIIAVEVNGKIHKHTFASFVYREVPLKVPDESKIISGESPSDPAILSQIKKNVIEANPDLHIKEDELTLEKYTNINKSTLVDVIAYRSNKEKVNCDASNHQYVYTGGLIGLKHLFKGKEVAPAPAPLTLATTELEEGQKVEVADPAKPEDFTSEQLGAIKDALNKVNAKVGNKDAVSAVKYEASKLVAVLSDNTTKVDLDASKLTKKKVVSELKTLTVADPELTEVANLTNLSDTDVAAVKKAIKDKNTTLNLTDEEIAVEKTTGKVTITRAGFKPVVLEANKVVTKKVVTPIEPPAPEPPAKESPREILKRTNPAMFVEQSRYAGKTALDTMAKIVEQAFPSAENVVLATQYGYWDALSANALAGSLNAPIMLSDFDSLPEQTVAQLKRLQAKTVYICGGTHVISKQVEQQLHQLGMRVVRYAGSEASDTATKIALNTETVSDTCFITTSWGYGDSMSVSSYSYAKHAPIFLTNMNGDIDDSTLDAIRAKGFKHIVLVGGTSVISAEVEDLVRSLGVSVERVWGETQYDTSLAFAKWATQDSKEPLTIGISTGYGFTDALCGAALTGKAGGVMVLADDSMTKQAFSAFKDFVGTHAKQIEDLQIFGGTSVVGMGVTQALTSEFKEAYQNNNASAASEGTSTQTQGNAGQTQSPLRKEN